jgi:hypothetical protein
MFSVNNYLRCPDDEPLPEPELREGELLPLEPDEELREGELLPPELGDELREGE